MFGNIIFKRTEFDLVHNDDDDNNKNYHILHYRDYITVVEISHVEFENL